jgi:hypothetical protein
MRGAVFLGNRKIELRTIPDPTAGPGEDQIDLESIFTHRWTLDQVDEAYQVFDTQSIGKGMIEF